MKVKWILFLVLALVLLMPGCKNNEEETEENAVAPTWVPIVGNQFNMIVLGSVLRNGTVVGSSKYWVGSYGPGGIDTDCRSVSPVSGDGTYYATVRGSKNGEAIRFLIWDGVAKKVIDASESLSFLADDTKNGFNLNFSESGQ